jgi:hypothetical protein
MASRLEPYPEDIVNRVNHDFAPHERERAIAILSRAPESRREWVQLAALRGASGRLELLQQWIDLGRSDWRDLQLSIDSLAGMAWEQDYVLYELRQQPTERLK